MNSRKWVNNFFFYTVTAAGLLALFIMVTAPAYATGDDDSDDASQQQAQGQAQTAKGGAGGDGTATATNTANGAGTGTGTADANNDGITTTTNNDTLFFSFNSSIPAAGKCFGAGQGGAAGDSVGGFLGFNFLNKDCWYAALANAEESVEIRALLKCGSKAFRNAVAYMQKRKDRQTYCVNKMQATYVAQLEFERAQVQGLLDAQTLLINDHVSKETVRTTDTLTRVVEGCTDCYGERVK